MSSQPRYGRPSARRVGEAVQDFLVAPHHAKDFTGDPFLRRRILQHGRFVPLAANRPLAATSRSTDRSAPSR